MFCLAFGTTLVILTLRLVYHKFSFASAFAEYLQKQTFKKLSKTGKSLESKLLVAYIEFQKKRICDSLKVLIERHLKKSENVGKNK